MKTAISPTRILRRNLATGEITDVTHNYEPIDPKKPKKPKETVKRQHRKNGVVPYKKLFAEVWTIPFPITKPIIRRVVKLAQWIEESEQGNTELYKSQLGYYIGAPSDPFHNWIKENLISILNGDDTRLLLLTVSFNPYGAALILELKEEMDKIGLEEYLSGRNNKRVSTNKETV